MEEEWIGGEWGLKVVEGREKGSGEGRGRRVRRGGRGGEGEWGGEGSYIDR